ncbi:polar amino acid ABC transporter permease [Hypericibacter adhaerens]|uniref:Glutamate/aspartate import permease protein GltK n=1 Tax=Hypericibacter adhaerens TaxID=2602016 RepID=A0A5J6MUE2_9PROT|nr:amino acid ABC transporter permease [Hypericibacter adhaerens]QEX20774.1 polar amino acid ABC transporter permease [Hypericibacter adhaerens]
MTTILGQFNLDIPFFLTYLFDPPGIVWRGLWVTIYVAVIAQILGVIVGLGVALARMSGSAVLRSWAGLYIWAWRGTPLLVQLLIVYTGVAAAGIYRYPDLPLGPFTLSGPMQAALFTLALNEGAYMAEIFRAAIQSIDRGQLDAAKAIGMRKGTALWFIILPQAARVVLPPLGNEFTSMIKGTSLLSVIGVRELFGTMQNLNAATFRTFELFFVAAIWYLILTSLMSIVQRRLEARLSRHELPAERRFKETFRSRKLVTTQR